jgi:actin-like ATPase involved in cell morphogenesis
MKGLDCGTGNYVAASEDGVKIQRNAFLTIDKSPTTIKSLKRLNVPFVEINKRLHVIGKSAYDYAQIFGNKDLKRPMSKGLLNPSERDALPVLREIISSLLGKPSEDGEVCVYCVPSKPIDKETLVDYHEDVLSTMIESIGYKARSIKEAEALGYAGLSDNNNNLTGISISMGAGMANIAIMYQGLVALTFSVSRGGDFIDQHVSLDTGIPLAKAQFIKESNKIDLSDNTIYDEDNEREVHAIRSYYQVLIKYLLDNIANQFEINEAMPHFPEAVPIVIGGGTSMIKGFIEVFKAQFNQKEFPINISEIKLVEEPLTAVARGCFMDAALEDE